MSTYRWILGSLAVSSAVALCTFGNSIAGPADDSASQSPLEEIIVTAEKRSERLLDVPGAVSAMSGDALESLQINSISDLANYVPGMSVSSGGAPGSYQLFIRGISTGLAGVNGPTVGTYIDNVQVGCATGSPNGGRCASYGVDLNPFDVEQIEVLKGPQGTLYGANTLSGLIKYSLYQPDTHEYQARVGGDLQYIDGSNRPSGDARAAINVPLVNDELALRVSGFYKNNAGWIDNSTLGTKDVNNYTEQGGRATLLWTPISNLTVKASALAQEINSASRTSVGVIGITPINNPPAFNGNFPSPFLQNMRLYSLDVDWNVDFATLTSVTAWSDFHSDESADITVPFGSFCAPGVLDAVGCPTYPHGDALVDFLDYLHVSKFVEEDRFASPENQRIQWMVGGYFTRESSSEYEGLPTYTPAHVALPFVDDELDYLATGVFKEYAGFANVTFKVTDQLAITGGGRYSVYSRTACLPVESGILVEAGALNGPSPCSPLPSTDVRVWLGDVSYHLSPDAMAYARIATGYRPGAGCAACSGGPGLPGIVNPDTTTNYEVGFKGQLLDRRLQFDVAVFYIDWKDIQLSLVSDSGVTKGITYSGNGGAASSSGVELTTAYHITNDLSIHATLDHTNAHLTQTVYDIAAAGDQLPLSPLWTASVVIDYRRPIDGAKTVILGANYQYSDVEETELGSATISTKLPPQNIAGVYAGVAIHSATIRLTGFNIFNNHAYVGGAPTDGQSLLVPVQPRTIGIGMDYKY